MVLPNAMPNSRRPPVALWKKWLIAARAFSLPASLIPVLFGGLLASALGAVEINLTNLVLSMIAMALMHIGANMLNDCCDYRLGLDDLISAGSGAVARGLLSSGHALVASVLFFAGGIAIGIYLAFQTSMLVLLIGIPGLLIGVSYSTGPYPLKHHALGDSAVFFAFGILGSLGSWVVQTGEVALAPVIWAIPISLFIIAIVHSNNWRDRERDQRKNIETLAGILRRGSCTYYLAMILSPFVLIVLFVFIPRIFNPAVAMPPCFLISLIALPRALKLSKIALAHHRFPQAHPIDDLDAKTAQLSSVFGLLCVAALLVDLVFYAN